MFEVKGSVQKYPLDILGRLFKQSLDVYDGWIRARTSFALLRSALLCLRGTRSTTRKSWNFRNNDIEIDNIEGAIY